MVSKLRFGLLLLLIALGGSISMSAPKISIDEILHLVNTDRIQAGLPQLSLNSSLNLAALAKAQDMIANNYFDHVSPSGTKPWHFFKNLGYNYSYAGENLALNYSDAKELETSWMNSEKHRENILSPHFADLGLAVVKDGDKTVIVEFFGTKNNQLTYQSN
jgi:uncharacterized protein YkwD